LHFDSSLGEVPSFFSFSLFFIKKREKEKKEAKKRKREKKF